MTISRVMFQTLEISMYLRIMYQYCPKNVNNFKETVLYLDEKHDEFINSGTLFFQLCKRLVFSLV